jgi:hypothetical protein
VELYFRESSGASHDTGVAICKDGTRVLKDITSIDQFQHAPWTESRVEGIIDFAALELAPGTRGGIVPDERLSALVQAVQNLEPRLVKVLEQREQAESDKASRDILRQVHRAFRNALRDLPSNEYLSFDIPESKKGLGSALGGDNGQTDLRDGLPIPVAAQERSAESGHPEEPPPALPFEPGPLASVRTEDVL